jgi:exodeoxyribonuclease VII large subunit
LTRRLALLIAQEFGQVWVEGEVSGVKPSDAGHVYFTLKDNQAQLASIIWRSTAQRARFKLVQGLKVEVRGRLEVYPQRGQYSLIVDQIQPKGVGPLELAFQQLKEELSRLGWFAQERKKSLPKFPTRVGIVTSLSGAALQDLLRHLLPRWPVAEVWVAGVAVQGEGAAKQIADAIGLMNRVQPEVDVLIVGRGGGSLEDLWAFNEREVAEAIFRSRIPVISAVGHETDFTIADFVADVRAATPTAAASLAVPDQREIQQKLAQYRVALDNALGSRLELARQRLERLAERPCLRDPWALLRPGQQQVATLAQRLYDAWRARWRDWDNSLARLAGQLEALSPLKVLGRGYSLTHVAATGAIVRSPAQAPPGTLLRTRLAEGELWSEAVAVRSAGPVTEAEDAGEKADL